MPYVPVENEKSIIDFLNDNIDPGVSDRGKIITLGGMIFSAVTKLSLNAGMSFRLLKSCLNAGEIAETMGMVDTSDLPSILTDMYMYLVLYAHANSISLERAVDAKMLKLKVSGMPDSWKYIFNEALKREQKTSENSGQDQQRDR